MTIQNDGWTHEISEEQRLANEVESCIVMTELYPQNEYWQKRLAAALIVEHEYTQLDLGAAVAMAYGEAPTWECPWTPTEILDERMNQRPEVGF